MKLILKDAIYLGERVHEFTDRDSGEVKNYAKITLMQSSDSEPIEINLDSSLIGSFVQFESYDLLVRVSKFDKKFSFKVIGVE